MKFQSLFDYRYFLKKVEPSIKDEGLKARLLKSVNNEIADEDFFLLEDSAASYLGELKHYSKDKTFYKNLRQDKLTFDNLPNLYALMTHLSIGLKDRVSVRDGVDFKAYIELKQTVEGLVSGVLKDGEVDNKLKDLL